MPNETEGNPRPVLPERAAEIHAAGSKLKFVWNKKGELEILVTDLV
jgi:hypothetical protein